MGAKTCGICGDTVEFQSGTPRGPMPVIQKESLRYWSIDPGGVLRDDSNGGGLPQTQLTD